MRRVFSEWGKHPIYRAELRGEFTHRPIGQSPTRLPVR